MNVSLPDKMREWIDQQVSTGRFANASDLVRDLIRDAQMREMAAGFNLQPPHNPIKA